MTLGHVARTHGPRADEPSVTDCIITVGDWAVARPYRLAGQTRWLSIVRPVIQKFLASLPGDDVDHGALHAAELRGRPHGLDLHFLDEVDARLGSRLAAARAREVRAIDEKGVLVGS